MNEYVKNGKNIDKEYHNKEKRKALRLELREPRRLMTFPSS